MASTVQLLIASPSRWTVQAPQFVVSHPTWVPVRPRWSRSQCTSRRRGSTSAERASPLTVTRTGTMLLIALLPRGPATSEGLSVPGPRRSRRAVNLALGVLGQGRRGARRGGDVQEGGDEVGVELAAGRAAAQLLLGGGRPESVPVGPVGGHGLVGVGDGEDAGLGGDVVAAQPARVA